jgi:hypothetical protein
MDDMTDRIEQKHASADAVECVGQRCRFSALEIDNLADEHRTAEVRHNKPHASQHFVIHKAIAFVTNNTHHGATCC